jgi:ankyrin repeat protein
MYQLLERETVQTLTYMRTTWSASDIIEAILKDSADFAAIAGGGVDLNTPDSHGCTALHYFAMRGIKNAMKVLIEAGADIDIQDANGCTALHHAIQGRRDGAFKTLIKAGADVDIQTRRGMTALHYATLNQSIEFTKALIEASATINTQDEDGQTALHYVACSSSSNEIIYLLLEAGADVDLSDKYGRTALHFAVSYDSVYCMTALMDAGSSMSVKTNDGASALKISKRHGNTKCITFLNSPSRRRTNVIARAARFADPVLQDTDSIWFEPAGVYFKSESVCLYASLLQRVLLAVHSRLSLSECRLVCKAWRSGCDSALAARPVEFFAPTA